MRKYLYLFSIVTLVLLTAMACSTSKGNKEMDIREAVWNQLPKESKEEVVGTWKDGTVTKVIADKNIGHLKDEKYIGKEVYMVSYKSKYEAVLGDLRVYADMETKEIIGWFMRD